VTRVYTELLAAGTVAANGDTVIYTAPATGLIIVVDVVLVHEDTVARRLALYGVAGSVSVYIAEAVAQPAKDALHWVGRQVLRPSEALHYLTNSTAVSFYRVTGWHFLP